MSGKRRKPWHGYDPDLTGNPCDIDVWWRDTGHYKPHAFYESAETRRERAMREAYLDADDRQAERRARRRAEERMESRKERR